MKLVKISSVIMIGLASVADLIADEPEYVGSKKCKMCHINQYKSWSATRIALTFDVLKPGEPAAVKKARGLDPDKDYTTDSDCLPCHTTGYGKPGGFVNVEKTLDLAGVGCESCHGPGSEYLNPELMSLKNKSHSLESVREARLIFPTIEENCRSQCHNEKSPFVSKDYKFDFAEKKLQGIHESWPLKYKHD